LITVYCVAGKNSWQTILLAPFPGKGRQKTADEQLKNLKRELERVKQEIVAPNLLTKTFEWMLLTVLGLPILPI
jgi:ABC-type Fe2+-enterobactin transport system substrate-binding protein